MSCNFVEGSALYCNDGIAGIQKLWLTEWSNVPQSTITETSGTITALTQAASTKFWLVDLAPENGSLTEAMAGGLNVPNVWTQTLSFTVNKPTAKLRNWMKIAIQNRLMALILDSNGTYKMVGLTRGAYVPSISVTSGKMAADFSGATITIEAKEPQEAMFVSSSVVTGLSTGA